MRADVSWCEGRYKQGGGVGVVMKGSCRRQVVMMEVVVERVKWRVDI